MGNSSSKSALDISRDLIRTHRSIFTGKKGDHRAMLKNDVIIQNQYKEFLTQKSNSPPNDGPIEYTEDFFKRFDDVSTITKILFEETSSTQSDPLADEEKELPDKSPNAKAIVPISEQDKANTFPIKLYIAEPHDNLKKAAPNLDTVTKTVVKQKLIGLFGLVHAGLQIGDKMVHFLDNHFVKIDYFKANRALYLISISKSGRLPKTDQVKTAIAEVIVEWNKFALYDRTSQNCQDFVEDLCSQVNGSCNLKGTRNELKLSFENTIIKEYIEELIDHPEKSGFYFNFKNKQTKEVTTVVFENHKHLDNWQKENLEKLSDDDLAFLKGFHRAYQLRHAAAMASKEFKLAESYKGEEEVGCILGKETV